MKATSQHAFGKTTTGGDPHAEERREVLTTS